MISGILTKIGSQISIWVVIACILFAGYWYTTNLQDRLAQSQQIVSQLEIAINQQKQAIQSINNDRREIYRLINQADQVQTAVNQSINDLEQKFNKVNPTRERRDIGKIGVAKPRLLENVINKATDNAFQCLEQITQHETKTDEIYQKCNIRSSN